MAIHDEKSLKLILNDLKRLRCTAGLSPETQMQLASAAVRRKYGGSEYVWELGAPGEYIAIIVSGLIEISRYTSSDEEMTMGVFGPSDVIGISAVMKKIAYPGSAKSLVKDSEVIKLYLRPLLQNKSTQTEELQTWVREMVLHHEQVLRDKIDILNAGSVENRVFELINHLIRRFGRQESHLKHFIPIRLTRTQVGKLIDARVETIIRLISRWQRQKLIKWSQDGILIENLSLLEKSLAKNRSLK